MEDGDVKLVNTDGCGQRKEMANWQKYADGTYARNGKQHVVFYQRITKEIWTFCFRNFLKRFS